MKETKETIEDFSFFEETNPNADQYIDRSMEIVERIESILKNSSMTQKDLAIKLKKKESEVSKWLSGVHNFTLRSIAKLEVALGESIIMPVNGEDYHLLINKNRPLKRNPYFIPEVYLRPIMTAAESPQQYDNHYYFNLSKKSGLTASKLKTNFEGDLKAYFDMNLNLQKKCKIQLKNTPSSEDSSVDFTLSINNIEI